MVAVAIFTLTYLIHAASPVTTSTDSAWTFHLAASILREGDVDLDEYRPLIDLARDYRMRLVRGHIYYYYPAATPLLVAPATALINALLPLYAQTSLYDYLDTHAPDDRTAHLEKLAASGIVALSAVLVYLVGLRLTGRMRAVVITSIFALGTSMWSTASRALWQHGPSVLLLLLALYLVLAPERGAWRVFSAGAILAFSYLVRPTNSIALVVFGLYALLNARHRLWQYVLGCAMVLLPFMAANLATYGNIFPPYSYQLFERLATPAAFAEALAGTLISPNRGLFVFTPVFVFSALGAVLAIRRHGFKRDNLAVYLAGALIAHWLVTSLFEDWGGAWSIGPRYFVDVIPYLALLLIPALESPRLATSGWRTVFVSAALIGVLIQVNCSVSPYPFMWNGKPRALVEAPERKWDWGDMQFLRGLCPRDPLEGRAPTCWTATHAP